MSVRATLQKARGLVAGGWTPGLSLDAAGYICGHAAEGILRFCLLDAVLASAESESDAWEADRLLVWAAGTEELTNWEATPGRMLTDVVQLINRALQRAAKVGLR